MIIRSNLNSTIIISKTLDPVWNEAVALELGEGADLAQAFYKTAETNPSAARSLVTISVELRDWDVTGTDLIGLFELELYAIMDLVGRSEHKGLESEFELRDSKVYAFKF